MAFLYHPPMRWMVLAVLVTAPGLYAQQPFSLQQVLSAPYASELSAAPVGHRFAWVEDAQGYRNLWVSDGKPGDARQITDATADDGQDINQIAWSHDGSAIAYTYGAELGPDEKPANPAHLQRPTPLEIVVQPLAPEAAESAATPRTIGEGDSPLFSHDGHALLFRRNGQIWIADLGANAGAPRQLVFDRGTASQMSLSPDGQLLAFVSTRGRGQREHSYIALFDMAARTLSFPAPSTDIDSAPVFSPDGDKLAWLRSPFVTPRAYIPERTSPTPWSIQVLDLATGAARTAYSPAANQPGSVLPRMSTGEPRLLWAGLHSNERALPNLSRPSQSSKQARSSREPEGPAVSSDSLIFASEADGWVHLYALDLSAPKPSPRLLTRGAFEIEDPTLDASLGVPVWASNQAGRDKLDMDRRHLWRLDVATPGQKPQPITQGAGIETHPTPSADGTVLVALVSDAQHPMHAALIHPDGSIASLHADTTASYPAAALVTPQQVLFPTQGIPDQIHGQLFLPPHMDPSRKHPALLFFHGGPRRQMLLGYPGMDYYSNAYAMNQYLASRGFIVLSVNYRGGIGYGLDFREAAHYGPHGASEYNDALAAAQYLRTRADVDPARIGVWGGSYGGYFTALALARNSDIFAAGVDFHGVHEWIREDNATDWLRGYEFQSLAEQERIAALAHASSPIADVDKWRSPVLLIHGDDDPDVAYTQTPTLADALRARNVHVEELIFPDEVHGFILQRDWLRSYQAAADFFERTLHPDR